MKPDLRQFRMRRADLLAFLHLTDRADLLVDRLASREPGTDFHVTLVENGIATEKSFRVMFHGIAGSVAHPAELKDRLMGEMKMDATRPGVPVCVFVFTMGDDRRYCGWVNEPAVNGSAGLRSWKPAEIRWRALDADAIAGIVAAVSAWYEAQRRAQAA